MLLAIHALVNRQHVANDVESCNAGCVIAGHRAFLPLNHLPSSGTPPRTAELVSIGTRRQRAATIRSEARRIVGIRMNGCLRIRASSAERGRTSRESTTSLPSMPSSPDLRCQGRLRLVTGPDRQAVAVAVIVENGTSCADEGAPLCVLPGGKA